MKVSCPSCSAKYSIADEKVRNRLAKIRCRKCETTIVIDGKTDPPTIQAAETNAARSDEYTVDIADNDQRQMNVAQIVAAYNEGTITGETYVWKDGMADWEPLANVAELNDALHRAAAEAAASLAPATSVPPSASYPAPADVPAAPADPFAVAGFGSATTRAATRGTGGDLFGAIDRAGSEGDLATSAAEIGHAQPTTGARNESSVLFSLSALTGGETAKPAAAARDAADDSGLIDLAALAARSDTRPPSVVAAPLGVSPLGAPVVGGSTSTVDGVPVAAPAPRSNGAMWIGLGIAIAGLSLGAVLLFKETPAPPPTTIAIPTALPTAPAEVAAAADTAPATSAEAAPATSSETSKSENASSKPAVKRPAAPKPAAAKTETKTEEKKTETKTEEKKTEAPKPKNNCNCRQGDLMCAMKCSAK